MDDVLGFVDQEEPNYEAAARLGKEALPFLAQLVREDNIGRASKAACMASHIDDAESANIVALAAKRNEAAVRVAAAASLRNLRQVPITLVGHLLDDDAVGVRKWTLKALEVHPIQSFQNRIQEIATKDPEANLRDLAKGLLHRPPPGNLEEDKE